MVLRYRFVLICCWLQAMGPDLNYGNRKIQLLAPRRRNSGRRKAFLYWIISNVCVWREQCMVDLKITANMSSVMLFVMCDI